MCRKKLRIIAVLTGMLLASVMYQFSNPMVVAAPSEPKPQICCENHPEEHEELAQLKTVEITASK